jgi:hypothetical protein
MSMAAQAMHPLLCTFRFMQHMQSSIRPITQRSCTPAQLASTAGPSSRNTVTRGTAYCQTWGVGRWSRRAASQLAAVQRGHRGATQGMRPGCGRLPSQVACSGVTGQHAHACSMQANSHSTTVHGTTHSATTLQYNSTKYSSTKYNTHQRHGSRHRQGQRADQAEQPIQRAVSICPEHKESWVSNLSLCRSLGSWETPYETRRRMAKPCMVSPTCCGAFLMCAVSCGLSGGG